MPISHVGHGSYSPHFGAHLSRAKGYLHALHHAERIGATAIQLFAGSPRQLTRVYDLVQRDPARQEELRAVHDYTRPTSSGGPPRVRLFFHAPYLINLSHPDKGKRKLHAQILCQELQVCALAGGEGVVVHTGKRKVKEGQTEESAYTTFVQTIQDALSLYDKTPTTVATTYTAPPPRILIETSAGEGNSIGVRLHDFARLYLHSGFTANERKHRLGIVIDTCHVFGAGYDLSTAVHAQQFLHTFHHVCRLPVSHVKLLHLNDSKGALGSLTDFHEHLGDGQLFANPKGRYDGLKELIRLYVPRGIPFVLETHDQAPYSRYEDEIRLCTKVWASLPRTVRTPTGRQGTADAIDAIDAIDATVGVLERVVTKGKRKTAKGNTNKTGTTRGTKRIGQ